MKMVKEGSIFQSKGFRVTLFVSHSLDNPLPEAIEMQKVAIEAWMRSGLNVEIRADTATFSNLKREAESGCDLFIFYGHGNEDGQLIFADGRPQVFKNSSRAHPFWKNLSGCIIFACFGKEFAKNLPCPWISFSEEIDRLAPASFMRALIRNLRDNTFHKSAEQALEICSREMKSNFTKNCKKSDSPMPDIRITSGKPTLSRLSPLLSGKHSLQYSDFSKSGKNKLYPADDPFVGRIEYLKSFLAELPQRYGDTSRQRVVWVSGCPGIGKSTLLRQFAYTVRDQVYHEQDEPIYLFQMDCHDYTTIGDLERRLIKNLKNLYSLKKNFHNLQELMSNLGPLDGLHVWILDDLTYLSEKLISNEEAIRFVDGIISAARLVALPILVVTSTRRPGPAYWEDWKAFNLNPLDRSNAIDLASQVLHMHSMNSSDINLGEGALLLFDATQQNTAIFKRSLINAVSLGITYKTYACQMQEAGLIPGLETNVFVNRMIDFEKKQLAKLESEHGFRYSEFLKVYYPLIKQAGWFTIDELKMWFGKTLVSDSHGVNADNSYINGIKYLCRLNFIAVKKEVQYTYPNGSYSKRKRESVYYFYLPPHQRIFIRASYDSRCALPDGIPLRGKLGRHSLLVELLKHYALDRD